MRIVAFEKNGHATIGVRDNEQVVDLSIASPDLPQTLRGLLAADAAGEAAANAVEVARVAFEGLTLLPPIQDSPKFL